VLLEQKVCCKGGADVGIIGCCMSCPENGLSKISGLKNFMAIMKMQLRYKYGLQYVTT